MEYLSGKVVLITGGTGSFGRHCVRTLLQDTDVRKIIVFSRDEFKQYEFAQELGNHERVRFFIGDVRDEQRLHRAFDGVDLVIHAAALKQVPTAEYNPFEAVLTNVIGAKNVINAAINQRVQRVIALSTDKACAPINLYGATKLVSDKLFVTGNAYAGTHATRFAVVRYGNVVGSRGSIVPLFKKLAATGSLPITDPRMTRFWISLAQGVRLVLASFARMKGGEIYVPKIPSMRVVDLATAIAPQAAHRIIGIRPGEKLHEEMISTHDAARTIDVGDTYVIQPDMEWWIPECLPGKPVSADFCYRSDTNDQWLTVEQLRAMIADERGHEHDRTLDHCVALDRPVLGGGRAAERRGRPRRRDRHHPQRQR